MTFPTAKLKLIPVKRDRSFIEAAANEIADLAASTVGNLAFSDGYTVQINPESLSYQHGVLYDEDTLPGKSGADNSFVATNPAILSFEIIFDRTGAVQSGDLLGDEIALVTRQGVNLDIAQLKKVVLEHDGDSHRPKRVKLVWGTAIQMPGQFTFIGQLKSLSFTYKKFNAFGIPLRAVAQLTFEETIDKKELAKREGNQSPDVTHLVTIKEGDSLPVLAKRIYGDSRYYIPIVKLNKLTHFRNLKPGQKLVFPPIK